MGQKPVVLLVEDNPGDVRLMQELLAEAGDPFGLEVAGQVSEAVGKLAGGMTFACILLDLTLPDSAGIATFYRVLEAAVHVPLIVLSGLSDEALALKTVREGAQDYLVKGHVDRHTLIRAVNYAIKRAEAERALALERNLLRSVIDNLLDAIYVKDSQGRYLLDNGTHRRLLGLADNEQITQKTPYDFFPEALAQKLDEIDLKVIETGQPVINREGIFAGDPSGQRWMATTVVPLRGEAGEVIGVVGIGRDISERIQAQEQLDRYHKEIRSRNRELEDDLQMAREIQQAFLPQQFPTFPLEPNSQESALRFCSRYLPTRVVGGDFFHVLRISDTQAGVFICDVMGHGVRAALVTAIQRALIEEMLPVAADPGRFLTEINRALLSILRRVRTPMFVSAFYVVIDLEEGRLQYANAGHPSPLHYHHDTGEWAFLAQERPGPALGVFPEMIYKTRSRAAVSHDLLVLFTDGLYEVEGPDGEYFDQRRLLQIFENHQENTMETLIDTTLEEVRRFSGDEAFLDDVCLVAVEIEQIKVECASVSHAHS